MLLLAATAGGLGVSNHLYFKNTEPSLLLALALLTAEPLALLRATGQTFSVLHLCVAYGSFLSTLALSIVAYRISPWHPLARIPGPPIYRISKVFLAWRYSYGQHHYFLKSLHEVYGPIVRVGPNEISIADAEAVSKVLSVTGLNLPKGIWYKCTQDPSFSAPRSLFHLNGTAHAQRRRLWAKGMSPDALQGYEDILSRRVVQLMDIFEQKTGDGENVVDLAKWLKFLMTDTTGDLAFSGGYEFLDKQTDGGLWETAHKQNSVLFTLLSVPWLAEVILKLPPVQNALLDSKREADKKALKRAQSGSQTKDLWYYLMNEGGLQKDTPLISDVAADGQLALVAGVDTASLTTCTCLYLLLMSPDLYRRAKEEVDKVYPMGESTLSATKHDELMFLNACIQETLRIHPAVPTVGPRQVPSDGESKVVAGHVLPPGTQIWVSPFPRHRNPDYFTRPDSFLPDRWLDNSKDFENHHIEAYAPFSLGPSNCVGKGLAKQEMLMIMSTLLQRYDFQFLRREEEVEKGFDREKWAENIKDYFICDSGPLWVQLTRRGSQVPVDI